MRFKGRTTLMNKDGHLGIVSSVQKPIDKFDEHPKSVEPVLKRT